jgi:hypothetical protein
MVIFYIGKMRRQFSHTKTKKPDTALQCPAGGARISYAVVFAQ